MWELLDTVNEPILLAAVIGTGLELTRRLALNASNRHEENRP